MMRPNLAGADEKMNEYQKIYEQFVECVNLEEHEDFADDFETAELLRHNTSKSGDVQLSLKKYIIHMKESQSETLTTEYLIDELPEIAEKNDGHKKFYEQIVEYMKTGSHEKLDDGLDTAEMVRFDTLKSEDKQNKSKEYIECKQESQSYNYDITSEITVPECLKFENKSEPKNHILNGSSLIQKFRTCLLTVIASDRVSIHKHWSHNLHILCGCSPIRQILFAEVTTSPFARFNFVWRPSPNES